MYYFLGISIFLASLLVLNFLVSLAASLIWNFAERHTMNWSPRGRKQAIFALRIFPLAAALVFVLAFLLPSYLLFEPHSPDEIVSPKLAVPALLSLFGITFALFRVFGTFRRTRNLLKSWIERSEKISLEEISVPVYCLRHPFPVIAVVGTFRPKMFIAEQIFDQLSREEISAAIRHETGHLAERDNLKRTLMRVCRDLLVLPMGRRLEFAWSENAEIAADEFAAQKGGDQAAVNLASALIKIARIVPPKTAPAMPLGAFLIEENNADITFRVRRLLQLSGNAEVSKRIFSFSTRLGIQAGFAMVCAALLFLATNKDVLFSIHTALEKFVALLQ